MRWLPFVYQYAIEIIVFTWGIVLAIKSNNLNIKTSYGKKYTFILIGGLLFFMILQAFLQFVAPII